MADIARSLTWRHIPLLAGAMFATFVLHELGHWAMGRALGYEMWFTLNGVGLHRGEYSQVWHQYAVTAAGPVVTVLQAVLAYGLVRSRRALTAFAFLFSALLMRFTAMMVSLIHPNDEARIGEWIGVGPWAIFAVVVIALFVLTVRAGRTLRLGWKSYGLAYLVMSAVIAAVVLGTANMPRLVF